MASNTVHAPGAKKQSGALVYLLHSAPGPVVAGHWAGLLSAPAGLGTRPPLPDLPPVKHKEWGSSSLAIIVSYVNRVQITPTCWFSDVFSQRLTPICQVLVLK